jgi:hypothetical protein
MTSRAFIGHSLFSEPFGFFDGCGALYIYIISWIARKIYKEKARDQGSGGKGSGIRGQGGETVSSCKFQVKDKRVNPNMFAT